MRILILSALLLLMTGATLGATQSLFFEGGGYAIEVVMGFDERPVVAYVLFTPPGSTTGSRLASPQLTLERLDTRHQILKLAYTPTGQATEPPAFLLDAKKRTAFLLLGRKRIRGTFDWTM